MYTKYVHRLVHRLVHEVGMTGVNRLVGNLSSQARCWLQKKGHALIKKTRHGRVQTEMVKDNGN